MKVSITKKANLQGEEVEAASWGYDWGYGWGLAPALRAQYTLQTLRGGPGSFLKARPRPGIGLELSKSDMFCKPGCVCGSALVLQTNDKTAYSVETVLEITHQLPSADHTLAGGVILAELSLEQGAAPCWPAPTGATCLEDYRQLLVSLHLVASVATARLKRHKCKWK